LPGYPSTGWVATMTAGPTLDDLWDDWKPTEQTALDFLLEPGLKGMLEWKHCKQYFVVIKPLVEH